MKTFALLLPTRNDVPVQREQISTALSEIASWSEGQTNLLLFAFDPCRDVHIMTVIRETWPFHINLWSEETGPMYMDMAHLIIQTNAQNVYQIGEPTGAEELFKQMGIDVTKMPIE